jgi:acyl-CoA thioesterase
MEKTDSMNELRNRFESDPFTRHIGVELIDFGDGQARSRLTIRDCHRNGHGVVHGGVIYSMAVWTMAVAANSRQPLSLGIQGNISFVKAVMGGTIFAFAQEISLGRKISAYRVSIRDDTDQPVAEFQGLVYRKSDDDRMAKGSSR